MAERTLYIYSWLAVRAVSDGQVAPKRNLMRGRNHQQVVGCGAAAFDASSFLATVENANAVICCVYVKEMALRWPRRFVFDVIIYKKNCCTVQWLCCSCFTCSLLEITGRLGASL